MIRVAMRGSMIVLALVFAIANAGTVLCDMDCAAGGRTEAAAAMGDGASGAATSHCSAEQMDSSRHDMPAPHNSSGGNTKHSAVHLHPRIVATATARIQISPRHTSSYFVTDSVPSSSGILARGEANLRNNNSSPPIESPPVFSSSVLRI
jgi:hypothetical protein